MALIEELNRSGNWLFRRRGYLPVILLFFTIAYYPFRDFSGYSPHPYRDLVYLAVSFLGLGVRIFTIGQTPKGTSGRNIMQQKADELNTTGIYSLVRHPLYLGNFIIWLGITLFLESLWFFIFFILVFWLYYERIMFAEEYFLREKFGQSYLDWSKHTPPFFPRFRNWKPGKLPFSWRNVFKREYNGFVSIFITFAFFDLARNFFHAGNPYPTLMWSILTGTAIIIWIILHTLKKQTKLFHVDGR